MSGRSLSARAIALGLLCLAAGCGGTSADVPVDAMVDAAEDAADTGLQDGSPIVDSGAFDTGAAEADASDATDADAAEVADAKPEILDCPTSQWEPNGTEGSANVLPDIDDCDGSGSSFSGVLGGGTDKDWWHYRGSDKTFCTVDPLASTSSGVQLCMFVACKDGATELKSCLKGTKAKSPAGSPGCCADGAGQVQIDFHCTALGTDDSADVFVRVEDPTATTCKPYTVKYHY